MAQRVVGVPWNQCTLSSWGRFSNKKASEWSAGILYEGAGRWTRIGGQVGGHHELEQQAAWMWQISTGLESWPLVDRHAPWMDFRGSAIHETPLGFLRLEGKFAIGHGQRLGMALHDGDVLLPGNPWSWTAWWTPKVTGSFLGLPALGWSEHGQWSLSWNSVVDWQRLVRYWKPNPGVIHLSWRFPEQSFEVSWTAGLNVQAKNRNPSTFSSGNRSTSNRRQWLGCSAKSRRGLTSWLGFWMWGESSNPQAVDQK